MFYGIRQLLLLVMANVSGGYLIFLCNDRGYYAVMKNAPSIGTLWVFSILELGLLGAVLGVLGACGMGSSEGLYFLLSSERRELLSLPKCIEMRYALVPILLRHNLHLFSSFLRLIMH